MSVTRRGFLQFSATALGLSVAELGLLEEALANPTGPTVVWLQGAACTGCSVSFLNRISSSAPKSAADALINYVNLVYHPNLMALAGESAVAYAESVTASKPYLLVVEGGVPTAFGGNTCWAWDYQGQQVTFQQAVTGLATGAAGIVAAGTCACWGGIPASGPNPTAVKGVQAATGRPTINVAGCPTHPDWIAWVLVQLLLGRNVPLDASGRPRALFGTVTVHDRCPRRERDEAGRFGLDGYCLQELGCMGPRTVARCPNDLWNGKANWCIGANAPCLGCTESSFPTTPLLAGGGDD